jgi:hypothetical protein
MSKRLRSRAVDGRNPRGVGGWWTSVAEHNKWQEFEELRVWRRSKTLTKTNSASRARLFMH